MIPKAPLEGMSRSYEPPYPKNMALLFKISYQLKERDEKTKLDLKFPLERNGQQLKDPYQFEIRFFYIKAKIKRGQPLFVIFAQNLEVQNEQYEIEIQGTKKIKGVMRWFDHEYINIVQNLRIMGEALVLLNPVMAQQRLQQPSNLSHVTGSTDMKEQSKRIYDQKQNYIEFQDSFEGTIDQKSEIVSPKTGDIVIKDGL